MKVTDVKTFVVDCFRTNFCFVKIYTDDGVTGVGEATLEYKEKALVGAVEHIKEYLVGKNPLEIEKHYQTIYRDAYWRGGPVLMSALSAVEMALWDILGKHLNVPVFQLLGGKVNDKVRIYVNGWFSGAKTPKEFAEKAKEAVNRGVTAMKWDPFGKSFMEISNKDLNTAIECVGMVRDAVGNDVDLLIEGHGRFNVATGIKIAKELEQFKPMFFEEPVPPDNLEALKAVRDKSPVPISAGERLYTLRSFKDMFEMRAADFIQPDISHAGGIMELKKIAAAADAYYIPFAPHNPSGPVANAATLQIAACCSNFSILEIMYSDVDYRKDLTNESLEYKDGYIKIPEKPGLGIEINEEECLKHPYYPHNLRHYTGELTDIRPKNGVGTAFYF
ncbi:MAG: galactonate dehydratase [Acutalibacteraceae bacterium]